MAECLKNTEKPNQKVLEQTVQKLKDCTYSKIIRIRLYGIHYLNLLNQKYPTYTRKILWALFQENHCFEVRKRVFLEIAKEKTLESKELVFKNANWNESSPYNPLIRTGEDVIKALSYYGEEGVEKIFEISKEYNSFLGLDFENIFIDLITKGKLSNSISENLFNDFLETGNSNKYYYKNRLCTILLEIKKEQWVPRLIDVIENPIRDSKGKITNIPFNIIRMLKEYNSKNCLNLLWKSFNRPNALSAEKREISNIIAGYRGNVPLEYYKIFLKEENNYIKIKGIKGLGRFDFSVIKPILLELLTDDNHGIHHSAFKVAIDKGFIINLIEEGFITKEFIKECPKRNDMLIKAIIKYNLTDQIEFVRDMANLGYQTDNTIKLYLEALMLDGQSKRAIEVFKKNFYNKEGLIFKHNPRCPEDRIFPSELFDILVFLPPDFMATVLTDLSTKIKSFNCNTCNHTFAIGLSELCEKSNSIELGDLVKSSISEILNKPEYSKEEIDILRDFIVAFSHIIQDFDEDWLIQICEKYQDLPKEILNKLLYQLCTICRTRSTLSLARKIANWTGDELTLHYCYEMYDGYYKNNGILRQVKESEIILKQIIVLNINTRMKSPK